MFPTYKLSDETQGLKYHSLIPVHSLPKIDVITKENKFNDKDKDKEFKGKILVLKCRSSVLKNKNKYSPKKVEIYYKNVANKKNKYRKLLITLFLANKLHDEIR